MKPSLKQWLSQRYRAAHRQIRERRIPGLVRELQRTPASPDAAMLIVARLREAWGNTGYSADLGYLEGVVSRALHSSGPFLECGAGLSTVVLGALTRQNGSAVWSLEQGEEDARVLRSRLAALGLGHVHVVHAPLAVTDGAAWYEFDSSSMPRAFATVFCDGPAVRKSLWPPDIYGAWRSPLVPQLRKRMMTFGEIVLDDAEDSRCGALIDTWRRQGLRTEIVETPFGRYVVATPSPADSRSGDRPPT